jgi:predicted histone-like DNA-binding protein
MAIKIKVVQKAQPGVPGGGEKKYYAAPVMGQEWDIERLTRSIEKISTVSGADIRAVLYALVDVTVDGLDEANIIRLGELGSLRVTLNSEGKATPEEVDVHCVKKAGVIFTPGQRIKEMLRNVKFKK